MIRKLIATWFEHPPRKARAEGGAMRGMAKNVGGLPFGGRLAVAAWIALSAMGSFADAKSAWFSDHDIPWITLTNTITVGTQTIHTKDLLKNGIASKNLGGGVELVRTGSIWTLRMSGNVAIGGIGADRTIIIELMPGAFVHVAAPKPETDAGKPKKTYGIAVGQGLLIHGNGTLLVSHTGTNYVKQGYGILSGQTLGWEGDLLMTDGASVRIRTEGVFPIHTENGGNEHSTRLSVVGALLETTGGKIHSHGDILFDRAAVNVSSSGSGLEAWGRLTIDKSFCVSMARGGNALSSRKCLKTDGSVVYAFSESDDCVNVSYDGYSSDDSVIGSGVYKFATRGGKDKAALKFVEHRSITIDGGEVTTCSPGGYGIHSVLGYLTVNSGLVRNEYSMDIRDAFVVSTSLLDSQGISAGWASMGTGFAPYDEIVSFLNSASFNRTLEGNAVHLIKTAGLYLNGGTVLSEGTESGVYVSDNAWSSTAKTMVSGGSLKGPVASWDGLIANADGQELVCVTNKVAGQPYSHVTSGWTAQLPDGYDTSSLYLDGENKLYFWVSEEYARKSKPSPCDLGFKVLSGNGWTDALFVTSVSGGTSPMTTIEQGAQIFLYYGFKNLAGDSDVTGFVNRFTLSTGAVFNHDWTDSVLHAGKTGWGGESYSPAALQNLAPGTYTLTCTLDATDALAETNEDNNKKSITFHIVAPGSGGGSGGGGSDPITVYHLVNFNTNGGGRGSARSVRSGAEIGSLPTPTRTGYTLVGWFTAATGGVRISESLKITESMTFYAHWTANGSGGSSGAGTIVVSAPIPLSVRAGDMLQMTFSRVGGSKGSIAVKAKTQTSTALMGVNGSADFDYIKTIMTWKNGDSTSRTINVPTYIQPWEGVKMLRVKLSTLATGTYAGNLVPTLDQAKIYVDLENPSRFGTVSVKPVSARPEAGRPLRLVFRRTGGSDWPIAVKYKVQTSTAIANTDFEYRKGVVMWGDGEDDEQIVEVPTYLSAAGKQLRVKLSTLTQGDYAGCVTPHVDVAKVYVPLYGCDECIDR